MKVNTFSFLKCFDKASKETDFAKLKRFCEDASVTETQTFNKDMQKLYQSLKSVALNIQNGEEFKYMQEILENKKVKKTFLGIVQKNYFKIMSVELRVVQKIIHLIRDKLNAGGVDSEGNDSDDDDEEDYDDD